MIRTFIVAGNGPSLADIAPNRVIETDAIVRTNSFFLEQDFHLGTRVDVALIAGDPRVSPFVFATLRSVLDQYDLLGWSVDDVAGRKIGERFLSQSYVPFRTKDRHVEAGVRKLITTYQRKPTTGVKAAILAHAIGAERIILAGIDFYSGPRRYAFEPGLHMRNLLGGDLATRHYDNRLHSVDLDRAILEFMMRRDDVDLFRSTYHGPLAQLLDLSPARNGPAINRPIKRPVNDWVGMAGSYPITALKILRKLRHCQRHALAPLQGFLNR